MIRENDFTKIQFQSVENELDDERKKSVSLASDLNAAKQDAERQLKNAADAMESMRYTQGTCLSKKKHFRN